VHLGESACSALGFVDGTLACDGGCNLDTTGCTGAHGDGQTDGTFGVKNGGMPQVVPDDGIVEAGVPLRFVDNGDGTVTDANMSAERQLQRPGGPISERLGDPVQQTHRSPVVRPCRARGP
jgi:hypothetical protein